MNKIDTRMLILARESRGITQHQLVAKIDNLNQGNYSKMEKGLLNIPDETLLSISKQLDYPISFFYKKPVNTPISNFYYRKRIYIPKKDLSVLEAKMDIIRLIVDELLDSIDVPEFKLPKYEITDKFSASDAARKLREFLKIPKGAIKNLVQSLEAAGILIYFIKTDIDRFDGITLLTDKGQPIIFINDAMPNDRKRFTIVHELIHLVCHIPFAPLPSDREEEPEANEGAAEFLMPLLEIRHDLQGLRYPQLGTLKTHWQVSKAALVHRAFEINAIGRDRYVNLNIELSRNGEKKRETGFVELDEPSLFNLMLNSYENEMNYSLEQILSLLSINKNDYFEYFDKSKHLVTVRPKKIIQLTYNYQKGD